MQSAWSWYAASTAFHAQVQTCQQTYLKDMQGLQDEHSIQIKSIESQHAADMQRLQTKHSIQIKSLQVEIKNIHADLQRLQDEHTIQINNRNNVDSVYAYPPYRHFPSVAHQERMRIR